jgi:hypothetical protein
MQTLPLPPSWGLAPDTTATRAAIIGTAYTVRGMKSETIPGERLTFSLGGFLLVWHELFGAGQWGGS